MTSDDPVSREAVTAMRRLQHEMRTPLSQIIGYTEMLEEEAEERGQDDLLPDLARIRQAAKKLLDFMDGTFQRENETTAALESAPAGRPETEDGPSQAADECGRLLLVGDDPVNMDLLARRLVQAGHHVETASGGIEALRRIQEGEFDVVMLDVLMPGMSGFEVLESIRRVQSASKLPVILATALGSSEDVVEGLRRGANDYVTKPFDLPVVLARVASQLRLRRATHAVESLAQQLEFRNAFIRSTFARYVSDEVAEDLLQRPEALDLRGEKRRVTILATDLRGFTPLTEALSPQDVVLLLNHYLGAMSEVIQQYDGTIDEFIGDAILALFGAPVGGENDALRALACAVSMQLAVEGVNQKNRARGLPDIEMGIGIATGEVIVGNIGSEKRTKYTAIGNSVNLAARVESYTVGGEILVSDETLRDAGAEAGSDASRVIHPKGFEKPVRIHRLVSVGGRYGVSLAENGDPLIALATPMGVRFSILEGKQVRGEVHQGRVLALSATSAHVRSAVKVDLWSDVRFEFEATADQPSSGHAYGKVISREGDTFILRFTSSAPRGAIGRNPVRPGSE